MKNKKIIVLFLTALTLAGCTDESDPGETEALDPIEEEAAVEEEPNETVVTEEELAPVSEEEKNQAEVIDDIDTYEEFKTQDVFEPTDYDAHLITDNSNTRVILFSEGEEQVYKSIFIKEDNRLKIIDLQNDQLLINSPL
ncbi:hypothetical protein [Alkalibacterium kapii]|uniref:Lipoprotein n=1 Tax=Alkalibacterium kapii TaxID=426704 RepID=A0A511AT45_9LACT|nr:hypothetical protein [Alkalibacterium kapii]GEK91374.1 hypothetical protein AKA01nite_09960 [Alkalibacterium kapii]